ncbi:DUF6776 family protein [Salinimonas lutimaris]|uniref:DUF6776 family protein n=1 Tax=Salinimonas lutimaris TaxID=914153 RepID=UPI0010C09D38|nr:DUF6776 family protein [Salinimonas lutimaris]
MVGLIIGALMHHGFQGNLPYQLEKARATQTLLNRENARLTTHNATLEARLLLSHEELSQALTREKTLRAELHKASETVAFYKNVMAPEQVTDGFIIDGLQIIPAGQATDDGRRLFQADFVLLQQINRRAVIKGFLNMCVVGQSEGKAHSVCAGSPELLPDGPLKYRFKFFQAVSFEFVLPASFSPEYIDFVSDVYQYTTKRQDFFWQADWQSVLQTPDDVASEHADGH